MLTLDDLSAEILTEIFELIHDTSRHTIFSLLRVNKRISDAALPFAYRELSFDFTLHHTDPTDPHPPGILPPECAIWKATRKVTVHSSFTGLWKGEEQFNDPRLRDEGYHDPFSPHRVDEVNQAKWKPLVDFLSRLTGLREVVFDCAERVPITLLQHLESRHPFCHLHVRKWTRLRSDVKVGDPYEEALARSPCLRSISARFVLHNAASTLDFNDVAFQRILALSPNLEELRYSSWATTEYAGVAEIAMEMKKFEVERPVRKTRMRKIKWGVMYHGLLILRRWESFFDLRTIETLELGQVYTDTEWLDYAIDHGIFSGLKHLSFVIADFPVFSPQLQRFRTTLGAFLTSLNPLESLSITGYHGHIDLPSILLHHGPNLRSLSLHQIARTDEPRYLLSRGDLELIYSEALCLTHLGIDVNRTIDPKFNEMVTYTVISIFPSLRRLTIYYDLGKHHPWFEYLSRGLLPADELARKTFGAEEFGEVYSTIDRNFAKDVWFAVQGDSRLEELILYAGPPDQDEFGPEEYPFIPEGLEGRCVRKVVRVSRNERDDLRDDFSALEIHAVELRPP
ncbi:hypothetical protein PQX77_019003 [Marasmius sp. AFHP31]|nr:hypothetical protein PQX77_019003 [Marasmius sp. AFHP31]